MSAKYFMSLIGSTQAAAAMRSRMVHFLLMTACLLFSGCSRKEGKRPLCFGHVASTHVAVEAKRGFLLAVEEINQSEDKILGHDVIVLHVENTDADQSVENEVVRLCRVNHVGGVLVQRESAKLPSLGPPLFLTQDRVRQERNDTIYHLNPAPGERGRLLARFARSESPGLHAERIGIVTDGSRDDVGSAFAAELPENVKGGTWTYASPNEFEHIAKEARACGAVFFLGAPEHLQLWLRAVPASVAVLYDGRELPRMVAADLKMPYYRLATFHPDDDSESTRSFVRAYEERFGELPGEDAANAYEALQLFRGMIQSAKVLELTKAVKALNEESWNSLSGKLTFNDRHWPSRTVYVVRMEQGTAHLVVRYPRSEE